MDIKIKKFSLYFLALFLIAYCFLSLGVKTIDAGLSGYSYRKTITVQPTNIDSDLTDFPVHVYINGDTDVGAGMQDTTNYYDIRFTDTNDNVLPYEKEAMTISGGSATGTYWVKTNLSATTGATIYMYYGKAGDTDGSDSANTWNSGYRGVWHLSEGYSTAADFYKDSTSNDNDGTLTDENGNVTSVSAKIGTGLRFNGVDNDVVNAGNDSSLNLGTSFTLSGWVNMDDYDTGYSFIIAKDGLTTGSYDLGFRASGKPYAAINDGAWEEYTSNNVLPTGSWHHIAAVRNSSNTLVIYVDGVATSTFNNVKTPATTTDPVTLGLRNKANLQYDGVLDEVRVENTNRSAAWIKFMYANSGGESDNELTFGVQTENTAPTITSISSDKENGSYKAGEVIDIDVTFSEAVTSTGNVTVTLETGVTDRTCTFTISNSTTGTCDYIVQAGDTSSDLTVSSISGTIADQSGNAMVNFTPTTNLAANKALVIDTTAPGPIQVKPYQFSRYLRYGNRGEDVRQLQIFLNTHGFLLAKSGAGSPGKETSFFGRRTRNALFKFQKANSVAILKPLKLKNGTGIFHIYSRKLVNKILSQLTQ